METLLQKLISYTSSPAVPMHMPGHKRNTALAPYLGMLGAGLDITEITGFDNLHDPQEVFKDSMELASRLWGSGRSFFLVNGSTGGILAGIRAATRRGDKVLVARNSHLSVYHALEVCSLRPVYTVPPVVEGFGIFGSADTGEIERLLDENPDVSLVILTSPTYEGVLSDIATVCSLAHRRGVPVLVDEAHGAHLGFGGGFPDGAVRAGADIVVQSLHKTLPSLTQTAIVHVSGELIDPERVRRQIGIFETSSPSYQLTASIDGCVHLLDERRAEIFTAWRENLELFDRETKELRSLRVLCHGADRGGKHRRIYTYDPGKLLLSTSGTDLSGTRLLARLRDEYHIELEMAYGDYALAMTGPGDTAGTLSALAAALREIDGGVERTDVSCESFVFPHLPEAVLSIEEALSSTLVAVEPKKAVGRIASAYLWAYPPGVPLLVPGEVVTADLLMILGRLEESGVRVADEGGVWPNRLPILD